MTAKPEDPAVMMWKRQFEAFLLAVEATLEGSQKIRENQLKAAVEAHAGAEATRKLLAGAGDAQALWRIQADWLTANMENSLAYWRGVCETAAETQSSVARCLCGQGQFGGLQSAVVPGASGGTLLDAMDAAYKRWLDSTRQFYAAPVVSPPQIRESA